jgi:hypothetical protein
MYTIIEDCSPYYIRFTHDGLDKVIDICKQGMGGVELKNDFTHHKFHPMICREILANTPLSQGLNLNRERVSMFVTKGGKYYSTHKDGIGTRISLNYTVEILDDKCVTSWYNDEDVTSHEIVGFVGVNESREATGFDKTKHTPAKSMIAQPNECILFNTDIWHDFDNSQSSKRRMVLTLRMNNPASFYFDDAKKALFGL